MEFKRNSKLVNAAFWNFLGASILTTVSGQLAVSTDAAIVSNLMGPQAMAAVNTAVPVSAIFLSLNSLLGVGASILAANAIGRGDRKDASRTFTSALYSALAVGVLMTVLCCTFIDDIVSVVCNQPSIRPLVHDYLQVTCLGVTVIVLSGMMNMMVQSDGRPRLVTMAVIAGAVTNVVLDIVFIKYMEWGIAGSAWATLINYAVTLCIASSHLRLKSCSYRLVKFGRELWVSLCDNLKQGLPLMIANVLLAVVMWLINSLVGNVLGSDGVYMVGVCVQLLLMTFVVLNGVLDAMFAIGGAQMGERDVMGVRMLNRRVMTFACAVLIPFALFVAAAPQVMAWIFGADRPELYSQLCRALRIFSMILLPFSLTVLMRGMYQVLGHLVLSTAVAVGQVAAIVLVLWGFTATFAPDMLWWGFPLSAALTLVAQLLCTWHIARRKHLEVFTLLPAVDNTHYFSASVACGDHGAVASKVKRFLMESCGCSGEIAGKAGACVNSALEGIDATRQADVVVNASGKEITVVVKDNSRREKNAAVKQAFGLNVQSFVLPCVDA